MTNKNPAFDFLDRKFIEEQILQEIDNKVPKEANSQNYEALFIFKDRVVGLLEKASKDQLIEIKLAFEQEENINKRKIRNKILGTIKNLFNDEKIPEKIKDYSLAHCIC